MVTVNVLNGNVDQAILNLKKKLQREQVFLVLKNKLHFTPQTEKNRKRKENVTTRHHKKRKMNAANNQEDQ